MVLRRIEKRSLLVGRSVDQFETLSIGKGDQICQFLTIFSLRRQKTKSVSVSSKDGNYMLLNKKE